MSSIDDKNPSSGDGAGFKGLNEASELENKGRSLCKRGHWALALPLYKEALELRREDIRSAQVGNAEIRNNDLNLVKLLVRMGDVYLHQDKPIKARELLSEAQSLLERNCTPDDGLLAPLLEREADALMVEEKYADAEPILKRAVDIYVNTLSIENRATLRSYYKMAKLYMQLDRPDDANKVIKKAIKYIDTPVGPVAEFRFQMALAQVMSKNKDDAEEFFTGTSDAYRQRSNYLRVVECLHKYASICRETGDYAQADVAIKEAARYRSIEHFYPEDIFVATLQRA